MASKSSRFLGKPNLPNGIVKNDIEHILFFRKPGGYRKPTEEMERRSRIETDRGREDESETQRCPLSKVFLSRKPLSRI